MIRDNVKKLLRKRDILFLTLAGIGDSIEEIRDPLNLVSSAYNNMYGFIPSQYRRNNFSLIVGRLFKTGHIERIIKDGKAYLRLTSIGIRSLQRDFPITSLAKIWNKKWIIVIFDIEETSRRKRDMFRNMLKNIGFGMLQQSVWITPLPIGQDIKELISSHGFSDNAFVLEVSHVLLGDPKALAKRVWDLDRLEEQYLNLKKEEEEIVSSVENLHGRDVKRHIKDEEKEKFRNRLRNQKRKILTFLVTLPPLPRELFPKALQKVIII